MKDKKINYAVRRIAIRLRMYIHIYVRICDKVECLSNHFIVTYGNKYIITYIPKHKQKGIYKSTENKRKARRLQTYQQMQYKT